MSAKPTSAKTMSGASDPRLASRPARAILLMIAAVACFITQDAAMKWLTQGYEAPQIIFFGRILSIPLGLILAYRMGGLVHLKMRRPGLHLMRIFWTAITLLLFVWSIALMPLADAIALAFVAPLFVAILSIPILKEKVGPRRWAAVIVGFGGVLLMATPEGTGWTLGTALALSAAATYAMTLITTRAMTATESNAAMIFWSAVGVMTVMGLLMIPGWKTPGLEDLWILGGLALASAVGQLLITNAFRYGEASLLAPFDYTALIWAVGFGVVLFGDYPTWPVLAGAAIIVAASLYLFHREARAGRKAKPLGTPGVGEAEVGPTPSDAKVDEK